MKTIWTGEFDGEPSIFVCNHDMAWGPIAMCASFDKCEDIRPWVNAQVLSAKTLPAYVRVDYWWPHDKWYTKILDYTVAYILAVILPPILNGGKPIPVYHDGSVISTLRRTVDALKNGKHIVLFPEHPTDYGKYGGNFTGFPSLGRLFYRRTGKALKFYPSFVDWKGKEIKIGEPIEYKPEEDHAAQAERISAVVEAFFRENEREQLTINNG